MEILEVFSKCESYTKRFDEIRKECRDAIYKMLDEVGGSVDFTAVPDIVKDEAEDWQFLEEADPCFVSFYDRHACCDVSNIVQRVSIDGIEGEYYECHIEDLNVLEMAQLYRCIAEYINWACTGKLICM